MYETFFAYLLITILSIGIIALFIKVFTYPFKK